MSPKFTFEIHPVGLVLELIMQLDEEIDSSMHLTEQEKNMLLNSEGFAVLCNNHENEIVGAGYAVSALEAVEVLAEVDSRFIPEDNQVYIYFVVVAKAFRRKKIGTLIRQMLLDEARTRGYKTGATHVRIANGWNFAGAKFYKPILTRMVRNFWPQLVDPDVLFMNFKL